MRHRRARLAALLATAAALAPRQPLRRRRTRLRATNDPITTKNPTLTRWLLDHTRKNPQQEDLEALLSSIAMGCKTISGIVQRAGVDGLDGAADNINVQGEEQKQLDIIANEVLKDALRYTGKVGLAASEEEADPMLVEEAFGSKYVAVFDPLDGSSNVQAAVATGTIFGIFRQDIECLVDDDEEQMDDEATRCVLNALQPGRSLVAAGYCMYSSSTVLVFSLGDGVHGFTLDPRTNEFVLSHDDVRIPDRGPYYSFNEGNLKEWDSSVRDYLDSLQGVKGSRYVGSMVADVHRTLLYGGIYGYPADTKNKNGKLRLLYEAAPMSFLVEQAGGRCSDGRRPIMDVVPTSVHQRVPVFLGSSEDVRDLEAFYSDDK